jgi:hypothetical protein
MWSTMRYPPGRGLIVGPRRSLPALALVLGLAACTVTLISHYDEVFDRSATALQRQLDAHLTRLLASGAGSDSTTYAFNVPFYNQYEIDLRSLLVRARSLPRNGPTSTQLEALIASVAELRREHQANTRLGAAYLETSRGLLNQAWQAVLALELAKKR